MKDKTKFTNAAGNVSFKPHTIICSGPKALSDYIEKYVNQQMGKGYIYKEYQLIEKTKVSDGLTKYQLLFTFQKKF